MMKKYMYGMSVLALTCALGVMSKKARANTVNLQAQGMQNRSFVVSSMQQNDQKQVASSNQILSDLNRVHNRIIRNSFNDNTLSNSNGDPDHSDHLDSQRNSDSLFHQSHRNAHYHHVNRIKIRRHRVNNKYYVIDGGKKIHFQSQFHTDACEMASIKNVLSMYHRATHISLWKMLNPSQVG